MRTHRQNLQSLRGRRGQQRTSGRNNSSPYDARRRNSRYEDYTDDGEDMDEETGHRYALDRYDNEDPGYYDEDDDYDSYDVAAYDEDDFDDHDDYDEEDFDDDYHDDYDEDYGDDEEYGSGNRHAQHSRRGSLPRIRMTGGSSASRSNTNTGRSYGDYGGSGYRDNDTYRRSAYGSGSTYGSSIYRSNRARNRRSYE